MATTETLTADQAAQRWPAGPFANENDTWQAIFAGADRDGFTGMIVGPPERDGEGAAWHGVYEFEAGEVTDRYVSKAGAQHL